MEMHKRTVLLVSISLVLLLGLIGATAVWAQGGGEGEASLIHPIPSVPVIVDGVRYEPEEISRFNGILLRFVITSDSAREGRMYAFTSDEGLQGFLSEHGGLPSDEVREGGMEGVDYYVSESGGPPPPPPEGSTIPNVQLASYWTKFFEHINYNGKQFGSAPGVGWPDLRYTPPGWNDIISSLQVATDASWATLYEHIYYDGNQLWVQSDLWLPDLRQYGWNDRASSVIVWSW
jgi:hypothetical protein